MTEEQAIERIRRAILAANSYDTCMPRQMRDAIAAWNEMKAIAREDQQASLSLGPANYGAVTGYTEWS